MDTDDGILDSEVMKYLLVVMLIASVAAVTAEDIETLDHHVYKNAKITRVEPDGITVSHDTGISRIPYTELPENVRSRFHFDAGAARTFSEATERQQTQIYLQAHPEVAPPPTPPIGPRMPDAPQTKADSPASDVSSPETNSASSENRGLDSAAMPKPITLRSEIDRGMAALEGSARTPDSPKFREYVESIANANKQKNTDTDGFCYGLYYRAWHMAWFFASSGLPDQFQQAFSESNANILYLQSKVLRMKLKLSEADVSSAAHGSHIPNEDAMFEQVMNSKRYRGSMQKP